MKMETKRFIWYSVCIIIFTTMGVYGILNGVWG